MKKCGLAWTGMGLLAFAMAGCDHRGQANLGVKPSSLPSPMEVAARPADQARDESQAIVESASTLETNGVQRAGPAEISREFRASSDPERRGELAEDLWTVSTPEAVETLRQLFLIERDMDVKASIVAGAADASRPEVRDGTHALLLAALTPGQPPEVRSLAAHLLTEMKDPRATALLQQFAQDADPQIREAAREALEAREK